MALSTATITYNLSDLGGVDFTNAKVWATTNVPGDTVIDTAGDAIRLGSATGSVADDGTGSVAVWVPGTGSNPATWQTYVHVNYKNSALRQRETRTFGPFTVTTSANLADLVAEQEVPPEYVSTILAEMEALLAATEAAAASGGGGSGIIPVASANSSTAYTVTAPIHGEKRLKLTLTGNATLTLSGGTTGEACAVQLSLIQDVTGSRTVTWPLNVDWGINGPPVLSSATGKTDQVYLTTDDGGSSWQGALIGNGYTSPTVPGAPTGVGSTGSSGQIALTWTQGAANGATVTQNKIYRGTVSGSLSLLTTISAATSYNDTTVTNGTTYYYKIAAVNAVGTGAQSSETSAFAGSITTIATDTFTAADSTTAVWNGTTGRTTTTGSKTWAGTGGGNWGILSNKAYRPVSGPAYATFDAGVSDATFTCTYTIGASANDSGIVVRFVDASNRITIFADPGGWYIQKSVAATDTNVAHAGTPVAATTYTLKVTCAGSSVDLYVDNVLTVSATIADAVLLAATKFGLASAAGTDHHWDNVQVTSP